jgi:hypothetical protein
MSDFPTFITLSVEVLSSLLSTLLLSSSDSSIYFYISILIFPWALFLVLVLITILYLVPWFLLKVLFN